MCVCAPGKQCMHGQERVVHRVLYGWSPWVEAAPASAVTLPARQLLRAQQGVDVHHALWLREHVGRIPVSAYLLDLTPPPPDGWLDPQQPDANVSHLAEAHSPNNHLRGGTLHMQLAFEPPPQVLERRL